MYLLLLILWIIFNGRLTAEVVFLGILICGWLYWFMCKHMGYSLKGEGEVLRKIPGVLVYLYVLVKGIIHSNLAVMHIILSPKMENTPDFIEFKTDLHTELAQVTLANSITLTPGTYTVRLEDGTYLVHGLDTHLCQGLAESAFVKQLRKLEG